MRRCAGTASANLDLEMSAPISLPVAILVAAALVAGAVVLVRVWRRAARWREIEGAVGGRDERLRWMAAALERAGIEHRVRSFRGGADVGGRAGHYTSLRVRAEDRAAAREAIRRAREEG